MNTSLLRSTVAAIALVGVIFTSMPAPARADSAARTRTLIGIALGIAAIATAVNVEHKNRVAHQVIGYLPDGSTVYADGHVVSPNGYSWYPSHQGEQVACSNDYCTITGNGNYGYNGGYYGNGYYGNAQHRRPPNP